MPDNEDDEEYPDSCFSFQCPNCAYVHWIGVGDWDESCCECGYVYTEKDRWGYD